MSDGEQRLLTPKEGCEECQELHKWVESARQSKSYMSSSASGYQPGKSRSRQNKNVRNQTESAENTARLAHAKLRLHEMQAHEGLTDSNFLEFRDCMNIVMRNGRDRA